MVRRRLKVVNEHNPARRRGPAAERGLIQVRGTPLPLLARGEERFGLSRVCFRSASDGPGQHAPGFASLSSNTLRRAAMHVVVSRPHTVCVVR